MKRVILLVLVLAVIGLVAFGVRRRLAINAKKNREAAYETKLRSFTQVLEPGMTRKQVRDYFHANNVEYSEDCCVVFDKSVIRHSYDDLVKIGQEDHPWYCGENNIYIAFQFADHEKQLPYSQTKDNDLDTLTAITIYNQLENCL
jgi:hypothetical protein